MFREQIIQNRINSKGLKVKEFLETMDKVIDRNALIGIVEASYIKKETNKGGRPKYATKIMLKMYFLSLWFNLSVM